MNLKNNFLRAHNFILLIFFQKTFLFIFALHGLLWYNMVACLSYQVIYTMSSSVHPHCRIYQLVVLILSFSVMTSRIKGPIYTRHVYTLSHYMFWYEYMEKLKKKNELLQSIWCAIFCNLALKTYWIHYTVSLFKSQIS